MKRTVFLLCKDCDNIFLTNNLVIEDKTLVCGQGCGATLEVISKTDAYKYFQEKKEHERQF